MPPKMTLGRQKIEMKKIEDGEALQICFSKRRKGLFKKASELCTLTGAELILLVYSPSGKAYTFGCPNVIAVIDRFLSQGPVPPPEDDLGRQYRILTQERMEECRNIAMIIKDKKLRLRTLYEGLRKWEFKNPFKYGKEYDLLNRTETGILTQTLIRAQAAVYSWDQVRQSRAAGASSSSQVRQSRAAGASSSRAAMAPDDIGIIEATAFLMHPMIPSVNMAGSSNLVSLMESVDTLLGGDSVVNMTDSPYPFEMLEEAEAAAAMNAPAPAELVDHRGKAIEISSSGSSSNGEEDEWMSFLRNSPGN